MPATWLLYVDFDDDLSYGETGEDITAYMVEGEVELGMKEPGDHVGQAAHLRLVLDDASDLFKPERVGAKDMEPGRYIRLRATHAAQTYTVFTGMIEQIRPDEVSPNTLLEAWGRWHHRALPVDIPLQTNQRADQIISTALAAVKLRGALTHAADGQKYVLLDITGRNELDSVRLWPDMHDVSLEVGKSTFDYLGDVYPAAPSLERLVTDVTLGEYGWFVEDGAGVLRFYHRQHVQENYTSQATFAGSGVVAEEYRYGEGVVNRCVVRLLPRKAESSYTLWQLGMNQQFVQGVTETTLRFRDDENRPIAPTGALTRVSWQYLDVNGVDYTSRVTTIIAVLANGARLTVVNAAGRNVYLQAGAQLTGPALVLGDPIEIEGVDHESRALYGERLLRVELPVFTDAESATDLVNWITRYRRAPRGRVRSITLQEQTSATLTQQLARALFDVVAVDLDNVGHDAEYFIAGIHHQIARGGTLTTQFLLESFEGSVLLLDVAGHNILDENILGF